jgi:lysophospholipase L1-like esterase
MSRYDQFTRRALGPLAAAGAVVVGLLAPATGAAATESAPTCTPVAVTTDQGEARTIHLTCDGADQVRLDSPALHGVVEDIADGNLNVRYRPLAGWYSGDASDRDRFVAIVANAAGETRVTVSVRVDPDPAQCDDRTLALEPTGPTTLLLGCTRLASDPRFTIVDQPQHGLVDIDADSGRATYTPTGPPVPDRFSYRTVNDGGPSSTRTVTLTAPVDAAPAAAGGTAPPSCTAPEQVQTNYVTPVSVTITCPADTAITVAPAAHGRVTDDTGTGTLTVTYRPDVGYDDRTTATDPLSYTATSAGGTTTGQVQVRVRPYRFVAFGDSVTAGFGYYGDGDEMSSFKLASCKPPAYVNGRCSSNSRLRGGDDDRAPAYTADFGLTNNVSWAAQFANGLQGGGKLKSPGQYANYAVTGSSPGDWMALPSDANGPKAYPDGSGALTPTLNKLLAENPDLVAFTIGANPILSNMMPSLLGSAIWNLCKDFYSWDGVVSCLEPRFAGGDSSSVQLRAHLVALYRHLLTRTTTTRFVVMPYHLPIPTGTSAGWDWWMLEGAIDLLNHTIDDAVDDVRREMPKQADRLLHVKAQFDPNATDPTKLARFNFGGSSFHLDPAACVPASRGCAKGGADDYGWDNRYDCHWWTHDADGPSHQATLTQNASFYTSTCSGTPWILSSDSGIHPNRLGYTQFASALSNLLISRGTVPPLP